MVTIVIQCVFNFFIFRRENSDGESSQNKAVKKEVKNPMSSLNDLPPIGDFQGRKFLNKASINLSDLGTLIFDLLKA